VKSLPFFSAAFSPIRHNTPQLPTGRTKQNRVLFANRSPFRFSRAEPQEKVDDAHDREECAMNERDALLRAVCANPDEDTPRLVFADWLDEHGEAERAEFIRLQIGLARGNADAALREREKALLAAHGEKWSEPLLAIGLPLVAYQKPKSSTINGIEYRRGFPYGVQIDEGEAKFADHAIDLFRCAPVQRIAFYHQWGYTKLRGCPELLRVRELSLDRSGYETPELAVFFGSKYLKNLARLELIADDDNGHLAPDGIELLSTTRNLPALRHLDLSHNWSSWDHPDEASWVKALLKGRLVERLESLWLRSTFLEDVGVEMLANSKRVRGLHHLNLSGNVIGEAGFRALATSPNLGSLTVLDLRNNNYDFDGPDTTGWVQNARRLLQDRFGSAVLLDGEPEPHPLP
jgi:uncharacterized protein (TIGR02996 family)